LRDDAIGAEKHKPSRHDARDAERDDRCRIPATPMVQRAGGRHRVKIREHHLLAFHQIVIGDDDSEHWTEHGAENRDEDRDPCELDTNSQGQTSTERIEAISPPMRKLI
jgi:hypothetical protein